MQKIPTLFRRDPDDMKRVLPEANPACQWVLDGEGTATRKFDGTCVRLTNDGMWWARREVKPGKQAPANYVPVELDENTGKTVGWEPIEQSAFAKFHAEALGNVVNFELWGDQSDPSASGSRATSLTTPGTYELVGPKVNGNPEGAEKHLLVRHGYMSAVDYRAVDGMPRDHDGLRAWLADVEWEGLVWHHPDGRMAKLKRRDFA